MCFSYFCDCGHIIIQREAGHIQPNDPWNAADCFCPSSGIKHACSQCFFSNIVFNNAERRCGLFTVQLRGPTVAPSETQSWFPVLKIECNFFSNVCFSICTFWVVLHLVLLSLLIKLLESSFCLWFCFLQTKNVFFCAILSVNNNKKAIWVLTCKSYYNLFICHVIFLNMTITLTILTSAC